jgi:hypothetical protein
MAAKAAPALGMQGTAIEMGLFPDLAADILFKG